ncbi:hypothetical protein M426DRAFT_320807 [Hypoxylon sp. CI-4A]|nr:hypothetical protein M426DRAFT_320807 [Hypoxylon sp. CI-4A]
MALVDYSSDSSSEGESASATVKRQKKSHGETSDEPATLLPPLPATFHDLYASTVRVSTTDDPTLHQGRKRVNPHKAGNWPSHLYIEWHPTPQQRSTLATLLSALEPALSQSPLSVPLTSFLTSDLGAPQPLHISLSRPIVLLTAQKDGFLEDLASRVQSSSVAPFDVAPRGLEWHRTRESARSFLVLRVGSEVVESSGSGKEDTNQKQNPHLTPLLHRCNTLVKEYDQPPLYAFKNNNGDDDGDDAFHVSIAWSFAEPTPEVKQRTEEVFAGSSEGKLREEILGLQVPVTGIKAKIGNVVTHVALPVRGKRGREE